MPDSERDEVVSVLDKIVSDLPASQRPHFDPVVKHLLNNFDTPLTSLTEQLLCRNMTDDEYRKLMFFPEESDGSIYPQLISSPPDGSPLEHPSRKIQIPFLVMLYLKHIYSGGSFKFASAFIRGGGVDALSDLLLHQNLPLRGQAVDCMMQVRGDLSFPSSRVSFRRRLFCC